MLVATTLLTRLYNLFQLLSKLNTSDWLYACIHYWTALIQLGDSPERTRREQIPMTSEGQREARIGIDTVVWFWDTKWILILGFSPRYKMSARKRRTLPRTLHGTLYSNCSRYQWTLCLMILDQWYFMYCHGHLHLAVWVFPAIAS